MRSKSVERVALALAQHLLDPLRAVAGHPLRGDVVRVVVVDDAVVGGDEEPLRRVHDPRELLVGDRAVPLELAGPARAWAGPGVPPLAQRDAARQLVSDVALAVRPQHVERRNVVRRRRLAAAPRRCARAPCRSRTRSAAGTGARSTTARAARPAPSTSLTIGPWWVMVTSSASGADRPFTWISSRTTSASRQPPSNSYIRASSAFSRSTNRSWVSAITFVKPVRDVLGLAEHRERVGGQRGAAHAVVVADEVGLVPEVRDR